MTFTQAMIGALIFGAAIFLFGLYLTRKPN